MTDGFNSRSCQRLSGERHRPATAGSCARQGDHKGRATRSPRARRQLHAPSASHFRADRVRLREVLAFRAASRARCGPRPTSDRSFPLGRELATRADCLQRRPVGQPSTPRACARSAAGQPPRPAALSRRSGVGDAVQALTARERLRGVEVVVIASRKAWTCSRAAPGGAAGANFFCAR